MSAVFDLLFWLQIAANLALGVALGAWGERLLIRERTLSELPLPPVASRARRIGLVAGCFTLMCLALAEVIARGGQATPEVIPSAWGLIWRQWSHQLLLGLILLATIVDWDGYTIPDQITFPGMLAGLCLATAVGELQLIHLWVDWSAAIPDLRGPYFPEWFDAHRHAHGFAWSLTGLIVGGALTWLVRAVSSALLGMETLGFGDVTFMAMIGSFLGWQPVVCAFLLAPLLGLCVGIPLKWLTNKPYIPYGPFLGLGGVIVLFAWGPIWYRTRGIFGDWLGLLFLGGLAVAGLVVLLTLLLAYRNIPVRETQRGETRDPQP